MNLAQKIAKGSVSLYNYLNRKQFTVQAQDAPSLPTELLRMIFDYLLFADQVRAGRVCKFWFNTLLSVTWVQYIREYGDAPAHFFEEGFDWRKEKQLRDAAEINFSNGSYWYETLAASPSNMHARRHYLVSSVRGMEVLVNQFYWTSSSYEEAAELLRSFTVDLATETSTSTRYQAGMWVGNSYVVPVFNTHGVNWTKFGVYEQGISQSSLPEEEGDIVIKLIKQHDVEKDYKMERRQFEYFRITEPKMTLKVVPNSKHKSKFLVYTEMFKSQKRGVMDHEVIINDQKEIFESFDGILAYWGDYVVYSTERSIEFYNIKTRLVDRVYSLNLDQLIFARVGINNDIMAYTAEDKVIAVWDLKQNKLLTTINYFDKVFPDDKPSVTYINAITVGVNKLLLNFGWAVLIDWRTKKVLDLPYAVDSASFLADGSLILSSTSSVLRIRFDVDVSQTVNLMKLTPAGEFVQEPVVLNQLDEYLSKTFGVHNSRSVTSLIDVPTSLPSYKAMQIHAVARVTGFWTADSSVPVTNPLIQALKQLKAPPMTTSVRSTERCVDLKLADWQPKEVVLLYERLIDGRWTPCNPFELKAAK